jgi:hypothetical protein
MTKMVAANAREWIEAAYGPGSAKEIIERLSYSLWESSKVGPPSSPRGRVVSARLLMEWGHRLGVTEIVPPRLRNLAYITPCLGGFRLSIRATQKAEEAFQNSVRRELELNPARRWMFAHELGHTLFYDRSLDPPGKTYGEDGRGEETLCNRFAAALLLPRPWMLRQTRRMSLESMLAIADGHGLPIIATARRLILDLGIIEATCVIIGAAAAKSWKSRQASGRPFPKSSIKKIQPPACSFDVTEEVLRSHPVVSQVFCSGVYSNSDQCLPDNGAGPFVEGVELKDMAPTGACVFLFHKVRPCLVAGPLFDVCR